MRSPVLRTRYVWSCLRTPAASAASSIPRRARPSRTDQKYTAARGDLMICASASMTVTRTPACARPSALMKPTGPPPMMITSCIELNALFRARSVRQPRPGSDLRAPDDQTVPTTRPTLQALSEGRVVDFSGAGNAKLDHRRQHAADQVGDGLQVVSALRASADEGLHAHRRRRQARPDQRPVQPTRHVRIGAGASESLLDPAAT